MQENSSHDSLDNKSVQRDTAWDNMRLNLFESMTLLKKETWMSNDRGMVASV